MPERAQAPRRDLSLHLDLHLGRKRFRLGRAASILPRPGQARTMAVFVLSFPLCP